MGDRSRIWLLGSLLTQWRKITAIWLQFAMTAGVFPLRPLAMLWHACGPEAATLDSWPAPQCCWNCIDILNFGHHLSTSIHCWCKLRQWYTVKSNNKPSHNAELSLSNHRYIASYMNSGSVFKTKLKKLPVPIRILRNSNINLLRNV